MRPWNRGLLPALCLPWIILAAAPPVDPNVYLDDVKYLASQDLRGRGTGTPELEKAAAFIAGKFREFGLKPVDGASYYQPFQVTTAARLGNSNGFRFTSSGHTTALRFPEDFIPLNISSAVRRSGAVVFAGYGITAPKYNYDDYAGIDVKNKFVLILRHEPQEFDESSVFNGKNLSEHATFASKASNAKMHGAAGIILISDSVNHGGEPDQLEKFGSTAGPFDSGIPVVQVKQEIVAPWLTEAGKDLDRIQAAINRDLKPQSFAFPESIRVTVNVDLERVQKTVHNVAGFLAGETPEYIIIGAHYDHLGLGEQYSMAPSMAGTVHPGADDNASGTAGVIELARWFSRQPKQKRGILFLTFAGEEMGLLGSGYYVSHPEFPLNKAVAMLNMDMIGRMRNGKLYVGGSGTGTTLGAILQKDAPKYNLNLDLSDNAGFNESSDHASFMAKQVPALFFFSGLHGDYHKPSDTWDKIEAPETARLLALIADIAEDLLAAPDRPQFVRLEPPAGHGEGTATGSAGGSGGYGPYFGSVPDFGEGIQGVKFADVREGSPAAQGGLKAGDILVEFDGKTIENLYDFTYALREKQPGDIVRVKVMRDGEPLEAAVTLSRRQ